MKVFYREHALAYPHSQFQDRYFTVSMPLLTPYHSFKTYILQGACPCLPPTTVSRQIFYREHDLAYPQPQFQDRYFTGSMPLLTPNHSFKTDILQGACPCLPPTTVSRHIFYREHALAYPQPQFQDRYFTGSMPLLTPTTVSRHIFYREHALAYPLPQFQDIYFTGSMPLLTPKHSFKTYMLQGACPCLPPTTVSRHIFYREHALAYPLPQFQDTFSSPGLRLYHNS